MSLENLKERLSSFMIEAKKIEPSLEIEPNALVLVAYVGQPCVADKISDFEYLKKNLSNIPGYRCEMINPRDICPTCTDLPYLAIFSKNEKKCENNIGQIHMFGLPRWYLNLRQPNNPKLSTLAALCGSEGFGVRVGATWR